MSTTGTEVEDAGNLIEGVADASVEERNQATSRVLSPTEYTALVATYKNELLSTALMGENAHFGAIRGLSYVRNSAFTTNLRKDDDFARAAAEALEWGAKKPDGTSNVAEIIATIADQKAQIEKALEAGTESLHTELKTLHATSENLDSAPNDALAAKKTLEWVAQHDLNIVKGRT